MKKLILLGGSRYLVPVIKKAHSLGIYVITCDYLPNNVAHKYSDEYVNVSVVDKEKVLEVALKKEIDGIMSFACDPGVLTAAYVAENMNLPFQCDYKTACVMQNKGLFREFLKKNGFNSPYAKDYQNLKDVAEDINLFKWPVIVKPTDSAGSKGVSKVDSPYMLAEAVDKALENSIEGRFIIEEYLEFDGYHSSTDVLTINGTVSFITFSDQLFDKEANNPYTPAFIIWPSTMDDVHQENLKKDIQRLLTLLGVKTGIYNIETCVSRGKEYIMEVSPRGGGCKIAEIQEKAYGIDLIDAEVRKAVSIPLGLLDYNNCKGCWCELVAHSTENVDGILKEVKIMDDAKESVIDVDISLKKGDRIKPFTGANMSIGDIFLHEESRERINELIDNVNGWLKIVTE